MPRKGHSDEQIVYALRQAEAGKKVGDICREMGVSQQAFYSWKKRYAGWGKRVTRVAPVTRGKPPAKDSGRGPHAGQAYSAGGAVKKSLKPAARRKLVKGVREAYQLSEQRACRLMGITRWSNRYRSRKDSQAALRLRLRELAGSRVRYGYRRLTVLLRREGWAVNAKRVYRLYREEELQVRTSKRDKRAGQA